MPDWFTVFHPVFASPELAPEAMKSVWRFTKIAHIPESATWRVHVRGIGLVVTAEWSYGVPGALKATEVDHVGGVPVFVREQKEAQSGKKRSK